MSDQAASPAAESGPAPLPAATEPSFDNALASRLAEMTGDRDREDDAPADRTPQDRDTAHPDSAKPADDAPAEAKAEDEEPAYTLKLKVDGKEEERTFKRSELTDRLQKAEAAQKRFEEAAAVRKAAESEGRAAAQERAQLAQALQHFTRQLQSSAPPEPDPSLLNSDPVEYLRQQHQYQQHFQQAQQATAAQAHLMRQEQAAQEQWYRAHLDEQSAALVKAIPEWADAEKAKAGKEGVKKALASFGFRDEEIGSIADSRVVALAHKAAQLDSVRAELAALKDATAKAQNDLNSRLRGLPPVRTERPGRAETGSTDGRTRAMQSLRRTGSINDAAAALRGLL